MIDAGTHWPIERYPQLPGRPFRYEYGSALRRILPGSLDRCPEDLGFTPRAVQAYNAIADGRAEPDLDLVRAAVSASVDHLWELDRAEQADSSVELEVDPSIGDSD